MLENSLKTREKFINKLKSKLDSMIESVSLLQKVDKKLLKVGVQNGGARLENLKMLQMRGGAPGTNYDFADVEKAALRKKAQILMQQKNIAELDKKLKALTADFEPVQIALENVKELINSIKVSFPENMLDGVVPNFSELPIVWQYNALHDVKFAELSAFRPGNKLGPNIDAFDVAPGAPGPDGKPTVPIVPITEEEKTLMLNYAKKFDSATYTETTTFDKLEAVYEATREFIYDRKPGAGPAVAGPVVAGPAVAASTPEEVIMKLYPVGHPIHAKSVDDQYVEAIAANHPEFAGLAEADIRAALGKNKVQKYRFY